MKSVVATGLQRASQSLPFPFPVQHKQMCTGVSRPRASAAAGLLWRQDWDTASNYRCVRAVCLWNESSGVESHTAGPESSPFSRALLPVGSWGNRGRVRQSCRGRARLPPAGGSPAPPRARPPFKPRATLRVPVIGRRPARRPAGCREL